MTLDRFVLIPEAVTASGLSRPTLYRYARLGLFPPIRKIGPKRSGVLESELSEWLSSRSAIGEPVKQQRPRDGRGRRKS